MSCETPRLQASSAWVMRKRFVGYLSRSLLLAVEMDQPIDRHANVASH